MTVIELLRIEVDCDAFAISAPEVAEAVDRPLAKDSKGNPYVPGSSVAGSLRSHLPEGLREVLMGSAPGNEVIESSRLRIVGTNLVLRSAEKTGGEEREDQRSGLPETTGTYRRHQTAIDRHRGAARPLTLRTSEIVATGAQLIVYLRYDAHPENGQPRPLATADVDAIASWRPTLGGSRSTGLGQTTATRLYRRTLDLTNDNDLLEWLSNSGPQLWERSSCQLVDLADTYTGNVQQGRRDRRWDVEIVDALFSAGEKAGERQNHTEFVSQPGVGPVIAGASLKGILRSRAEFITRSRGGVICDHTLPPCGECLVCELFGVGGQNQRQARRSRIAVLDAPIQDVRCQMRSHVAIDRFTGGASDRRLFSHQVAVSGWLSLVVRPLTDVTDEQWQLLELVVSDIVDGYVGIGAGVSRGYGTVQARKEVTDE